MSLQITINKYRMNMQKALGQGRFGKVYKGEHVDTGKAIAAKQIEHNGSKANKDLVQREMTALERGPHHPNILQLLKHEFVDNENSHELWLFTEFCEGGNLIDYFVTNRPNLARKLQLMTQCAGAIAFLHNLQPQILHRDIKPANILIKNYLGVDTVKIGDFGLRNTTVLKTTLSTFGGNLPYMAPEMSTSRPQYKAPADTFSLGVVFLHMMTVKPGQKLDDEEVVRNSLGRTMTSRQAEGQVQVDPIKRDASDLMTEVQLKVIICSMLKLAPEDRASVAQIEHRLIGMQEDSKKKEKSSASANPPVLNSPSHLAFHDVHGSNVRLSDDKTTATCISREGYAVCFSASPVPVSTRVRVKLLQVDQDQYYSLGVGFTQKNPIAIPSQKLPIIAYPKPGWWVYLFAISKFGNAGDVAEFYVKGDGEMMRSVNGGPDIATGHSVDIRQPLWAIIDVAYEALSVQLVDY